MHKRKAKIMNRILAMVLAITMVIGIVPLPVYAVEEGEVGKYTITVQDTNGVAVGGAGIKYDITFRETPDVEVTTISSSSETAIETDAEGKLEIDLSSYADKISESNPASLTYTVTKDGYETLTSETAVSITNVSGSTIISNFSVQQTVEVGNYTVIVKDTNGAAVDGAGIKYDITFRETPETEVTTISSSDGTTQTDAEGKLEIDLSEYADKISESNPASLTYTVTKDGYETLTSEVSITDTSGSVELQLLAEYTVKLNITGDENATEILLNNESTATEIKVVEGTKIPLKIVPKENYCIKALTIDGESISVGVGDTYNSEIKVSKDTIISAEIVPIHTVSVLLKDTSSGTATISFNRVAQEGNEIKVAEGEKVNVEIVPAEKCYIKTVMVGNTSGALKEDGTYIADIDVTSDIVISAEVIQQYTVSVDVKKGAENSGNGSATVKLNSVEQNTITVDAETKIEVEIAPTNNSYIGSLTVGGEEVTVTKGETYKNEELIVDKDIDISAEIIKQYAITIPKPEIDGGKITVKKADGTEIASGDFVDEGEKLSVEINAYTDKTSADGINYWINSVTIGDAEQTISDKQIEFKQTDIVVASDITIKAEFVQVFTITVTNNQSEDNMGNITATPSLEEMEDASGNKIGAVTVKKGTAVKISAIPSDINKYRVCSVVVNGNAEVSNGANGCTYEAILEKDKDYVIEVTFALNQYEVTAEETENGIIEISEPLVDYGKISTITVTPNEGYVISSILVNEKELNSSGLNITKNSKEEDASNTFIFTIGNIEEAQNIKVTFAPIETLTVSEINIIGVKNIDETTVEESDAVNTIGNTYIFPNGIIAAIRNNSASTNTGFSITTKADGNNEEVQTFVNDDLNKIDTIIELTGTTTIIDLKVNRQIYGLVDVWQTVALPDGGIRVAFDGSTSEVTLTPEEKSYEVYSEDVTVAVNVAETENDYSGIAKVEYWVTCDDIVTQGKGFLNEDGTVEQGILYFKEENGNIEKTFSGEITVIAEKNISPNVVVHIAATDIAGNTIEQTLDLKINPIFPELSITMEDDKGTEAKDSHYKSRTATLVIKDKDYTYTEANINIEINAVDINGEPVGYTKNINGWTSTEIDQYTREYTAKVYFDTDATKYTWSISYINGAGLDISSNTTTNVTDTYEFTVDKTAPTGTISFETNEWGKVIKTLTFGLWKTNEVKAVATIADVTSGTYDPKYYKSNSTEVLSGEALEELYKAGEFVSEPISISSEEKFAIYARLTDYAGNTSYISTDGVIIDLSKGMIQVNATEKPNEYGFYNKDVDIYINVEEIIEDVDSYSGIKEITYRVDFTNPETAEAETKEGILYKFSFEKYESYVEHFGLITKEDHLTGVKDSKEGYLTYDELTSKWEGTLILSAEEYNADNIIVTVMVKDNAGNEYEQDYFVGSICIDEPTLKIQFNDTANKIADERGYFNTSRTATLTITDRASAFDREASTNGITFTAVDANGEVIELGAEDVKISNWSDEGNVHTVTVEFLKDGNYRFLLDENNKPLFTYTNKAGNTLETISTENSVTPYQFTVDTAAPAGSISINKNTWDEVLQKLTFGLYSKVQAEVTAVAKDATSPVIIEYFKTSNPVAMGEDALAKEDFQTYEDFILTMAETLEAGSTSNNGDTTSENFTVKADETLVIYLKITDYAGHTIYCSSDGYIVDTEGSTIELKAEEPNANGLYNKNAKVTISVEDIGSYSGIKTIDYYVVADGNEEEPTQKQNLYNFAFTPYEDGRQGGELTVTDWSSGEEVVTESEGKVPVYKHLKNTWTGSVTVEAEKNNCCNAVLYVRVVDNAENESISSVKLDFDVTKPAIEVKFDNNKDNNGNGYFDARRTATIVITERTNHFDAQAATNGITVHAVDAKGNVVEDAYKLSNWVTKEGKTPNEATHTATLSFVKDANYNWSIAYTDKAGNVNSSISTGKTAAPFTFTVDTKTPTGIISFETKEWDNIIQKLTFGLWKRNEVKAVVKISDITSKTYAPLYYKSDSTEVLNKAQLEAHYEAGEFVSNPISVHSDEKFAVYARLTDYAGNTSYISTDGVIIDLSKGMIQIEATEKSNEHGFYNKDVGIYINVEESIKDVNSYSGIKEITYKIDSVNPETGVKNETKEGMLYTFSFVKDENYKEHYGLITKEDHLTGVKDSKKGHLTYSELTSKWDGTLILPAEEYNADNIIVTVMVKDNAGNEYEQEYQVGNICIDEPKLEVQFDDTANKVVEERGYFNASRTATLTITDRASAFDREAATNGITFTAVNAKGEIIELSAEDVEISNWSDRRSVHTATVRFLKDGNYRFIVNEKNEVSFTYTNKAGNVLKEISTGDSVTPCQFTVDTQNPTGSVSINENTWDKVLRVLTFGLYSNVRADVTAMAEDETSPVIVEYFKTSNPIAMGEDALAKEVFEPYKDFTISADETIVVYLKITDYAGHTIYCSSDGYIVDRIGSTIELKTEEPNANGLYNKNVKVDISVEDIGSYSGIKTIDYYVVADGNEEEPTQKQNLYNFAFTPYEDGTQGGALTVTDWSSGKEALIELEGAVPVYDHLKNTWTGSVTVEADKNNCCNAILYVRVVDNAGNESISSVEFDFDVTKPAIEVSFDNNKDNNGNGYFDAHRTATIVITERTHHFDAQAATEGITVHAVDAKGNVIEDSYELSNWVTKEGKTANEATHTATISFIKDANYEWSIAYTDKADNANSKISTGETIAPFVFTVDTVKPISSVKATSFEGRIEEWNVLRDELRFGFWSKEKIVITGSTDDVTSDPTKIITQYYKVTAEASEKLLTISDLEQITEWQDIHLQEGIAIEQDEQFVVYLKMTDLAGNVTYVCTNGLIMDHNSPMLETIAPEITITPQQPINDIYHGDVKVDIKITDPLVNETYSGLKTLNYKVLNMGEVTQEGILYEFGIEQPKQEELLQTWEGAISVSSALNNSNDVSIMVYAEDNALNSSEDGVNIKIDITAPTIDVSYSNNAVENEKYFKEDRTATIVVTERNFDPEGVILTISNSDGSVPGIGSWDKYEGSGNGDNSTWTTNVSFSTDGDYTFDIRCTDLAGNPGTEATYGSSAAPREFTIDKTIPTISVSYDNNNAQNDKYFNEARTATVTVTEHNFSEENVTFTQTSSLNGGTISNPSVSWSGDGDTHIATIVYSEDGDYTFDMKVKDLASNESTEVSYGNSVAGTEFTVDQTIEKPVISGVENGRAYKDDVIVNIDFSDVNYASQETHLYRTRRGEVDKEVTEEFIKVLNEHAQGGSGSNNTFDKLAENDGIYRLNVKVQDKAGNEEMEEVTFTVNRFGSVYEYKEYLLSLLENGGAYKQRIDEDLVLVEYNADRLLEDSLNVEITCDGKPLENVSYTVSPEPNELVGIGGSGWFQYEYVIAKENFASDGIYKVFISSEDATGNLPENTNYEDMGILFRVDSEAPEITSIVGLEEDVVDNTKIDVKYSIYDTIGLKSLLIYLDGEVLQEVNDFSADMNNYSGAFTINESTSAQEVRFIVTDMAGNTIDTNSDEFESAYEFVKSVTVTTNALARWYANKELFYGTIAGAAAFMGAVAAGIGIRKRKKNRKAES